jgi:DNA polymerase-3 subunit delta'
MNYTLIAGQHELKKRLFVQVQFKHLPHAIFISGDDGIGALPLAHALAQHVLCQNPVVDQGGCETCSSCMQAANWSHPDLHLVFPIIKSKDVRQSNDLRAAFRNEYKKNPYLLLDDWLAGIDGEQKQPVIPVEEAHTVLHNLSLTSYEGRAKIVVVWQPALMNTETSNKLLKILEEPPLHTYFILASGSPEDLLPTIVSRLQTWNCIAVSEQDMQNQALPYVKVLTQQGLQLSHGNMGLALQLSKANDFQYELLDDFQHFMRQAFRFNAPLAFTRIEDIVQKGRSYQKRFLIYGLHIFRQSLLFREHVKALSTYSKEEQEFVEKFAAFITIKNCEPLAELFSAHVYYIERHANPKILFTDLLFLCSELLNPKSK